MNGLFDNFHSHSHFLLIWRKHHSHVTITTKFPISHLFIFIHLLTDGSGPNLFIIVLSILLERISKVV
jgi:hypothetical protein